ncbi:unnamed protein product [Cylicocyclus nassatus]|uniref:Ammonium transporter n=1 Tax=Cylicocyclus nassatus TaxID=53992 RepID=A0AA36MIF7_CYLNA|nr:unnamed protein product [Cylicocyclus nassatus]
MIHDLTHCFAPVDFNISNLFQDDSVWIITASFTIFTMTSGFGLLESGRVSSKDEVNIMVKNVVDVIFGGLSYWMFGFGFTFGQHPNYENSFIGTADFFFDPETSDENTEGWTYASFIYQMSFATTTSAIVSAGMAERVRLKAYIIISFVMTLIHSIPAHWVWSENGVLFSLGVIDSAGCSVVHLVGGISGMIATIYLRPRQKRFGKMGKKRMSNPTNAILGTFMLWWGWLAFNTGSTYGVSHGKWYFAAKSAVGTIMASTGGGVTSLIISKFVTKRIEIDMLIDGMLASLVSSSACCSCFTPWQAYTVGSFGAAFALLSYPLLEWVEVDDPVGIIPVHVIGSIWGMISAGIFARDDPLNWKLTRRQDGLLSGGGFKLIGKQLLGVVIVSLWSAVIGFMTLFCLQHSRIGLRLTRLEEEIGADLREHGLSGHCVRAYELEKKLTPETAAKMLLLMVRWKVRARRAAQRRRARESVALDTMNSDGLIIPD